MSNQRSFLIAFWVIVAVGAVAMFARSTAPSHPSGGSIDPESVSVDGEEVAGEGVVASSRETAADADR